MRRDTKNDCMFFALEHFDKLEKQDVHHLHIVVSTVRPDGSRVSDSFEQLRLKKIERSIELELGLQYCPAREKGERRNLTTGEARQEERTGQPCLKRQLWQAIDQATADHPMMAVALMRVKAAGFEVRFAEHADGGKGISFGAEERYFRGGRLGDRYSFNGLQKYAGVSYHPQKDDSLLRQLEQMSQQQCQQQLQTIAQEQRERERQEQEQQRLEELRRQQTQHEQERLERERLEQQQQAEAEQLAKFQQEQDQWIDEIVPTAIEAVRWNKRNPKFVHRINESQIEISGSAYWARWNHETRQLDYYRRADGQHLFTAMREADQDSWTFQQTSDLTQADLDFHRQAATRLAELYEAIEVETNEAEEEEEEEEEEERER
ncbi:hypothetical protein NDI45_20285 [Leptolyngbya sp. GB1-A1]